MMHNRLRFYVILALMVSAFLNGGFFLDNLISVNDNKRSASASNTADAGLSNFGGNIYIAEGNFSGAGNMLVAKQYGQLGGIKQQLVTNTSFTVSYADWNATAVQIDASQMETNASTVGELQMLEAKVLPTGAAQANGYAQEIQIPFSTTLLMSVMVYFFITRFHNGNDIFVEIWNATNVAGIKPDRRISSQYGFDLGTGNPTDYSTWVLLPFSTSVELKSSQTVGNVFYISLSENGPQGYISWYGANDSVEANEYNAWLYSSSTWISYGFDFSLNTTLGGIPRPSEVDLRVNGTAMSDIISGNGTYYSSFSKDLRSPLLFTVTAKIKVKLNLKWILSISKLQSFDSSFYIQREWSYSEWNATQTVAFLMNTYSRGMNITIPKWNIERVVWNSGQYSNWTVTRYSTYQKITIVNATTGTWTIECNSTNYIKELLVRRGASLTYRVNCTDTVSIYTNFRQKLRTGSANLTVFPVSAANYDDSVQIQGNTSIQFTPWNISNTATENPGIFTLQVMWCNGTEVGLNATSLNVLSIPTNLTHLYHKSVVGPGSSIYAYVNFSDFYNHEPILGASLLVKNSTNNANWPAPFQIIQEYLNGTYYIEILTFGLVEGEYAFSINLSKPLYLSSEVSGLTVTIGGGPSNVNVTAPGCRGLLEVNSSYAVTNPAPYHNTTVKVRIFYYSADRLQPLTGGIVVASWIGGGPPITWVPAFFGYYNITIDVTGFHAGTNHTLKISIQQEGYSPALLYVIVPIKKVPTTIEPLQMSYNAYLEKDIIVFAVFKNTLSGESIPSVYDLNGNFTIQINGFTQYMTLLLPNLGLYHSTLTLSQLGLEEGGNYTMTLFAFSQEHKLANINVSLHIIPRTPVYLVLLALPPYLLAGTDFKFYAQVTISNGTPLCNTPVIYKKIYYPGFLTIQTTEITNGTGFCELQGEGLEAMQSVKIQVEYLGSNELQNGTIICDSIPIIKLNSSITLSSLPTEIQEGETLRVNATLLINGLPAVGELIKFTVSYEGSAEIDIFSAETNEAGMAWVVLVIPTGVSRLYITASFEGVSYINASSGAGDVGVYSFMTLLWRYAYIWLTITLAVVGGTLTYKYGYKRTKNIRQKAKWDTSAQKFQNALNVNFLMMVLKNSGLSIYNYSFKGEKVDYELMSGFLSAISMFKRELIKTDKKEAAKKPEWEMNYQEFKIYGIDRDLVQYIFILEESPSESLKKIIATFVTDVEDKFHEDFVKFRGDTTEFKEIDSLIKYHFETTLIMPHYTVNLSNDQMKQLSDLERQIYNLGQMFMKQQGYFHIPNLLNSIAGMSKKDRNQILHEIYGLIRKNYFTASKMSLLLD